MNWKCFILGHQYVWSMKRETRYKCTRCGKAKR